MYEGCWLAQPWHSQPEGNEWTIVLNFRSQDELTAWQRSSQRAEIVGEAVPLFEGGTFGEVAQPDRPGEQPGLNVTEVILSKIKSEHAARVLAALPEDFALECVTRMLRMEPVQREILDKIEQTLRT